MFQHTSTAICHNDSSQIITHSFYTICTVHYNNAQLTTTHMPHHDETLHFRNAPFLFSLALASYSFKKVTFMRSEKVGIYTFIGWWKSNSCISWKVFRDQCAFSWKKAAIDRFRPRSFLGNSQPQDTEIPIVPQPLPGETNIARATNRSLSRDSVCDQ